MFCHWVVSGTPMLVVGGAILCFCDYYPSDGHAFILFLSGSCSDATRLIKDPPNAFVVVCVVGNVIFVVQVHTPPLPPFTWKPGTTTFSVTEEQQD